jgi:uncharacterized repeat protein (TIGR03803 family)
VAVDATQEFTATVTGTSNTAVTWSVNSTVGGSSTVGSVSSTGLYTAPDFVPSSGSVTVTATSQADSTKSASATVSLTYPAPILSSVSPTYVLVNSPETTLTVTGSGFTKASTVSFNNNSLSTTFVSGTQLTAALLAADESAEGQFNLAVVNPPPGGGTSSALEFSVAGGALTVNIIDLPASTPANVTVTGPNGLNVVLTSSQTITGMEGTYNVTAAGVAVGSSTYYATKPAQSVTLAAGNSAALTVDYYTIIPNTTKVLDQAGMQTLSISADGKTITISDSSAIAKSLAVGDVLASAPTQAAPNGLLVKVLTVADSGGTVTVTITQATLVEAITQADFSFAQVFSPSNTHAMEKGGKILTVQQARNAGIKLASDSLPDSCSGNANTLVVPFNQAIQIGVSSGSTGATGEIGVSGQIEICPELDLNATWGFLSLKSLTAVASFGEHAQVTVGGQASGSLQKEIELPGLETEPVVVVVADVPVVLQGKVTPIVGVSGEAEGGFYANAEQDAQAQAGLTYSDGKTSPVSSATFAWAPGSYSLDSSVGVKGYAGLKIGVLVYGFLLPNIAPDAYLQWQADLQANPWWTLNWGVEANVGVDVGIKLLGKDIADVSLSTPDIDLYQQTIAHAAGSFSTADVSPTLTAMSPNSGSAGTPSLIIALTGSNFVPDSVALFNGNALSTSFVDPGHLTAALPATAFLLDGLYPITVSNPDTSGAVSSALNFAVTGALVSISPSTAQVPGGGKQQFTATVLGPSNHAATWSVNGVGGGNSTVGTISAAGLYTAPTTVPNPATVTVTATSQAFPSVSGSASVTIGPYTEKAVYSFTSLTDGAAPSAGLIQATDGYYYGTAQMGGAYGYGTVFKVNSPGNVTPLHEFSGADGAYPTWALIQASDSYFYGVTPYGGAYDEGTIFRMDSSGGLTTLYSFTGGSDGAEPSGDLVLATDGYFYGVTFHGGDYGAGVVFRADSSGGEAALYSFSGGTDGYGPEALIQASDGNLYGTTQNGGNSSCTAFGASGCGTVFKTDTAGHLNTLYSFTGGADGAQPEEALLEVSGGLFYGTTLFGGDPSCTVSTYTGCGTIFAIDSLGDFSLLHEFSGGAEGGVPFSALTQGGDGDFYGTATAGGDPSCSVTASGENYPTYIGCGTVFKMDSAGEVNALYSFTGSPNDGSNPFGTLIEGSDGFLYGTTRWGGTASSCPYTDNGGCGTVFKVTGPAGPLPQLRSRESKGTGMPTLNPMPLISQPKIVPVTPPRQEAPRVPNLRGVKQPPIVQ